MIITYPHKILRKQCEDVLEDEFNSEDLLNFLDMLGYLVTDFGAVGLTAPQIGVPKNIIIFGKNVLTDTTDNLFAILNPKIIGREGKIYSKEGCLSLPGMEHDRERSRVVIVQFNDIDGANRTFRFEGYGAIVAQHMIDHLNGHIMLDDLTPLKRKSKIRLWNKEYEKKQFEQSISIEK